MGSEEVLQAVREICAEILGMSPSAVTPTALLRDELGADSLDFAEMVMALEDRTGVSIPEEKFKDVNCAEDVVGLVLRTVSAAS